jgi:hypothetical protein
MLCDKLKSFVETSLWSNLSPFRAIRSEMAHPVTVEARRVLWGSPLLLSRERGLSLWLGFWRHDLASWVGDSRSLGCRPIGLELTRGLH